MGLLSEMQQFLAGETKKIAARSGMTEDQLARFAENPDNFSPEQWKSMQTVKAKITERGQQLKKVIQKDMEEKAAQKPKKTPLKKKAKITKSGWIRS